MELYQTLRDQHDWSRRVDYGLCHGRLETGSLYGRWLHGAAFEIVTLCSIVIELPLFLNSGDTEIDRYLVGPMDKPIQALLLTHQKFKNRLGPASPDFEG